MPLNCTSGAASARAGGFRRFASAGDPFWANVKLSLHGNNNFTDSSTTGNTFTSTGPPTFDSTNYKFGTHAISCNGSNQYLTANSVAAFELGANNYCIEFWLYLDASLSPSKALLSKGIASGTANEVWTIEGMAGSTIGWFPLVAGSPLMQTATAFATATWYHIAIVRNGSAHAIYVNGVSDVTATASYAVSTGGSFHIGRSWYDATMGRQPNCNFDDIRITVGNARYTGDFTPPTAANPDF